MWSTYLEIGEFIVRLQHLPPPTTPMPPLTTFSSSSLGESCDCGALAHCGALRACRLSTTTGQLFAISKPAAAQPPSDSAALPATLAAQPPRKRSATHPISYFGPSPNTSGASNTMVVPPTLHLHQQSQGHGDGFDHCLGQHDRQHKHRRCSAFPEQCSA